MGRVNGKVAVVTGAVGGLGAAHARRLIEEGAKVVLTDLLEQEGNEFAASLGEGARFIRHDVTKESEWKYVVSETEKIFGPVTVLVNNAGIVAMGAIEDMDEALYRRVIDVDQVGVFLGMKSVIPSMRRAGGGSIINLSSVAGLVGAPYALPYTASKFAVRGMTKAAAVELAGYNIRVNSVHPGIIMTPLLACSPEANLGAQAFLKATPAGRGGEPDEVANIVLLLASDESRFSTGAEFVVDGGFSCQ